MKAIVVTDQAAGTAGMTLVERPDPPAAINDVIVAVHASGFVPTEMAWPSTWTDRRDRCRSGPHTCAGADADVPIGLADQRRGVRGNHPESDPLTPACSVDRRAIQALPEFLGAAHGSTVCVHRRFGARKGNLHGSPAPSPSGQAPQRGRHGIHLRHPQEPAQRPRPHLTPQVRPGPASAHRVPRRAMRSATCGSVVRTSRRSDSRLRCDRTRARRCRAGRQRLQRYRLRPSCRWRRHGGASRGSPFCERPDLASLI
jgi:hypothetical protein